MLAKHNRYLWRAGLFLVWLALIRAYLLFGSMRPTAQSLGQPGMPWADPRLGSWWMWAVGAVVAGALVVYYFKAKAAIVAGIDLIQNKQPADFGIIFKKAKKQYGRVMLASLGLIAALVFLAVILSAPVVYLAANQMYARAVFLGVAAALIFLPMLAFLHYGTVLVPMFMVKLGLNTRNSLRASMDTVRKFWPFLVGFTAILLLFECAALFFAAFLVFLTALPLVLFNGAAATGLAATAIALVRILAIILGTMAVLAGYSYFSAFRQIAWVLMFDELVRPVKAPQLAQEAVPPVPEAAA